MVTPNNYVGTIIIVNCLHMYVAAQQQNNNIITYDNDHIFFVSLLTDIMSSRYVNDVITARK